MKLKNAPNTISKILFSHSGKNQKKMMIKRNPILPKIMVNFGEGFLPVIISNSANTIAPPSSG